MFISPFRPDLPAKKGGVLFEIWMTTKLEEWRYEKAVVLTRNSVVPCLGSLIMPDLVVKRIAKHPRHITDESSLRAFCRHWAELDIYKDEILATCRFAVAHSGAGSELYTMDRERINKRKIPRRKIQPPQQPLPILSDAEQAKAKDLEERLQRRTNFVIKYGPPPPAKKPQRSKKSSEVSSQTQSSSQVDSSQIEGFSQGEAALQGEASQPGQNSLDRVSQGTQSRAPDAQFDLELQPLRERDANIQACPGVSATLKASRGNTIRGSRVPRRPTIVPGRARGSGRK